ncbi:Protein WVD2-like 7 [Glycine soja]
MYVAEKLNKGDSSACLMQQQPFCYASGFPKEANKSNPNNALGQSVSFGRFMPESLAWEKWSTFSHNRYVEEAERFTRPGSVAQKKAFFEAHYKKLAAQKAAALLEQANSASQTQQEQEEAIVDNTHNLNMTSPKSKLVLLEENAQVFNSEPDATTYNSNSNTDAALPQSDMLGGAQPLIDHQAFVVKLQNQLGKVDNYKEPSEEGTNFDQNILQSTGKKKQAVSSFKLLKVIGTPKFNSTPVKSKTPSHSSKDGIATPMSALTSSKKEGSTSKLPHMSLNFTLVREINKLTVSLVRKFGSTGVGASSSKASKDSSTLIKTTTKASKNESQKHSSLTPLTEAQRSKRKTPIISSPFRLSTEERASIRKKKLEKVCNASESQKVQPHTKFKEKADTKIRKLRQSICFIAGSSPDFYQDREASKKDRLTPPESPKEGRKPTLSVVESKSSLPRNRPFQGKNCGTMTLPRTSNSSMITTHENTSPNIQHRNQNDRNYKQF